MQMRLFHLVVNWRTGLVFGAITLLLNYMARQHPEFVESWYSRCIFQWIRICFAHTTGCLPFPAFYLFWTAVAGCGVLWYRNRPQTGKIKYFFSRFLGFVATIIGLFYWLWAFNYSRVPLVQQLQLEVRPRDAAELWSELLSETQALDSLRHRIAGADTLALNGTKYWPVAAEDSVRHAVETWMLAQGLPVSARVRGREIHPEGLLFAFGAAGIYWPFVGEGNIEAGLHPLQKLPSMAHEMSHGYGFTDEGVCNFMAYAACYRHPNPYIAYCARLDYWETLAGACMETDPERYRLQFRGNIPVGIAADERAIREQHRKFSELAPAIRYEVYDSYLKAQGIASGMLNYDEVLMLVGAWKRRSQGEKQK